MPRYYVEDLKEVGGEESPSCCLLHPETIFLLFQNHLNCSTVQILNGIGIGERARDRGRQSIPIDNERGNPDND